MVKGKSQLAQQIDSERDLAILASHVKSDVEATNVAEDLSTFSFVPEKGAAFMPIRYKILCADESFPAFMNTVKKDVEFFQRKKKEAHLNNELEMLRSQGGWKSWKRTYRQKQSLPTTLL